MSELQLYNIARYANDLAAGFLAALALPTTTREKHGRYDLVRAEGHPHAYVIKPPRSRDENLQHHHDHAVELLSVNLAQEMDVDVVPTAFVDIAQEGNAFVSVYWGNTHVNTVPPEKIANQEGLHVLEVFETWIMNQDDQARHFLALDNGNGAYVVKAIDHGHTFDAWRADITHENVATAQVVVAANSNHRGIPVTSWEGLAKGIALVRAMTDERIDSVIEKTTSTLRIHLNGRPHARAFLDKLDHHAATWRIMLRRRRDGIEDIIRAKHPTLAPPRSGDATA